MASFDNNLKIDRLLSALDGDAKRSIQLIFSQHHTLLYKEPLDNQNGNSDNRKQSLPKKMSLSIAT